MAFLPPTTRNLFSSVFSDSPCGGNRLEGECVGSHGCMPGRHRPLRPGGAHCTTASHPATRLVRRHFLHLLHFLHLPRPLDRTGQNSPGATAGSGHEPQLDAAGHRPRATDRDRRPDPGQDDRCRPVPSPDRPMPTALASASRKCGVRSRPEPSGALGLANFTPA